MVNFVFISSIYPQGLMASMAGPTTPDLRDRLGVDMETISLILAFKNIGVPVGCILSGIICDRYLHAIALCLSKIYREFLKKIISNLYTQGPAGR